MKREKQVKSLFLDFKDLDETKGIVSFYFASWSEDLEKDIILKTAYTKTLQENRKNIYHNRDHCDAIGSPISFGTDDKGAYCVSQLALKTINGRDAFEQYQAGLVKGHSQEFETILDEYDYDTGIRTIKEVRLWGVTSVTNIPANLDTPTISMKSYEEVADHLAKINKLLTTGKISDALGEKFLQEYKSLNEIVLKIQKEDAEKKKGKLLITDNVVKNFSISRSE